MKIVKPSPMTLLSCSVSETDAVDGTVWSSTTTYSTGQKVRYNHESYQSVVDNNVGNQPDQTYTGDDPKWMRLGATMPYRMLDDYQETQTVAPVGQDLTFSVSFVLADSFAFLNVQGGSLEIKIIDGDVVLNEQDLQLVDDIQSLSLYEYYFTPITMSISDPYVKTNLPLCINAVMNVTIHPAGATDVAALGHVVVGRAKYIGETKYGAEVALTDYSRKDIDAFGYVTFVRRSYSKNAALNLYVPPSLINDIIGFLSDVRATPIFVEGGNNDMGFETLAIFGWIEDWRTVYTGPNENELSVEIQGLI